MPCTEMCEVLVVKGNTATLFKLYNMKQNSKEITLWARRCSVTLQGMNEGYVWDDGCYYCVDDDEIANAEFRRDREHIISYIPKNLSDINFFDDYDEDDEENYRSAIDRVKQNKDTDEDLKTLSYLFGLHYYTEWMDDSDIQYVEIDGVIYDEEDKEFIMAMELNKVAQNLG